MAYDIHRSTDLGFTPGPETLVATTFSTAFVDAALLPGVDHAYVVRARDAAGNVDANTLHVTVTATVLDVTLLATEFEPNDAGWTVVDPDDAEYGNWQWGNPQGTAYQSEDDHTPGTGVNAWITGLSGSPSNGDVDNGTTTLLSARYDIASAVNPVVAYWRWFTNDRGGSPGDPTDTLRVEISDDDGQSWEMLEEVGAGTPLAWVPVELALPAGVAPSSQMRLRFSTADLGEGSLVEAGIDDFAFVDPAQGCSNCDTPQPKPCSVVVSRSGDADILLSFTNLAGRRIEVYNVTGCDEMLLIGTTTGNSFLHEGALLSTEPFNYRLRSVDACGNGVDFCGDTDCP